MEPDETEELKIGIKHRNLYTSVACNCTTECADWGKNGWIVFGAFHAVGICDPKYSEISAKILHTYVRHTKRVNTVKWVRHASLPRETFFLSGSDDTLAILWDIENPNTPHCYPLKGHDSGVNALAGIYANINLNELLLATAAADSTIKLWRFNLIVRERCECIQTIMLDGGFCFSICLTQILPFKSYPILLAFSSDDAAVSLWSISCGGEEFKYVYKLTGHEDWVRALDFVQDENDLLLASGAQDNFIRLWRISPKTDDEVTKNNAKMLNLVYEGAEKICVEEKLVQLDQDYFGAVTLESVLYGHDGWVYGVQWHKSDDGLQLLSASIDKTLIVWQSTEDVWMEKVRLGEVGGSSLGFLCGKFSPDGKSIFGHSFNGAFHVWNQSLENENIWIPKIIVGGHFNAVRDVAWDPQGAFMMSVSADQTTRIHAPWFRSSSEEKEQTWHELARPQIHGYDMQTLAILTRYKFASGGEEKIVRTFQAPTNFIENFRRVVGTKGDNEGDALLAELPKGASVPSLGLSNKAVFKIEGMKETTNHIRDEYPENYFVPVILSAPPQEEILMQNTLWPEMQKLYGHGYEIYALAASPDGQFLASSCRATSPQHAQIIIWNTRNWKQIQTLSSHNLTVTQMCFSPNGQYLLSVSRDRRWTLFEKQESFNGDFGDIIFSQIATTDKSNGVHTRIIWSCDWSHDNRFFATTSREGRLVIWCKNDTWATSMLVETNDVRATASTTLNNWIAREILELKNESITAVGFAKRLTSAGNYIIALGFETGNLKVYGFGETLKELFHFNKDYSHHSIINRLRFRPNTDKFHLASCGNDNFIRLYELDL